MTSILISLGFRPKQVVETILSTISAKKEPNAAPIGVWINHDSTLSIYPFEDTFTAHNLQAHSEAVINITSDPRLFFHTAFKRELGQKELFWFQPSHSVEVPSLRGMDAYIEVNISPLQAEQKAGQLAFQCHVRHINAPPRIPQVFSRAQSAAIECIIHATRIRALHDVDQIKTDKLLTQIQDLQTLVQRIAPESVAMSVIDDVMKLLDRWVNWI
jgi:hypothetical protein